MSRLQTPNFKLQTNKGFTLLELLIYTALLASMSIVIVNVFFGLTKARGGITVRTEVNSNLRFAVEKINQDIRAASVISTPASPGGTISPDIVMTTVEGEITYCISSNKLRRQLNGICNDSSAVVTSDKVNVTALTFTRFENTNSILNKTVVTVQTSINIAYASTSPDLNYSANQVTIQSPL